MNVPARRSKPTVTNEFVYQMACSVLEASMVNLPMASIRLFMEPPLLSKDEKYESKVVRAVQRKRYTTGSHFIIVTGSHLAGKYVGIT